MAGKLKGRKAYVMAAGAVGLAGALTAASFIAPNRASAATQTYVPVDAATVVAHVPQRDPKEIAERQALAAAPDRVELAVDLAREEIQRARTLSDPRYLGRAQALLARWWSLPSPPPDVLLLRATIEQSLHQFDAARADLDALLAIRPDDAQAHLTRAVVATVRADYPAARESCRALQTLASPLVAATCEAPLDALAGDVNGAYTRLAALIDARSPASLRTWALTTLAELAIQKGDNALAASHLERVLALDPDDAYARAALADALLPTDPAAASHLLAGYEQVDTLLVRRAIAESRAHGPDAAKLAQQMRDRFAAAAQRQDRVHLREEAMFVLYVESNAPRALEIARDNWFVQKELADARLLAEAAVEARDAAAAQPVIEWARATGVRDARLDALLTRLGGPP
ncbi:MAG TPA: tetratricopeptide repeat protein [Kofleriaceae bacterium]|nr:tetratricopeptide repeat protein [Kofleriaceae bacterium]